MRESESMSFRKQWYLLGMLISKKKPLKILYNSVSLENFLPFSIRFIFSHFKGLFVKGSIIVFQEVLLSVTFISRLLQYDFFFSCQQFFTKISLKSEVLLFNFSYVLQKLISRPFDNCFGDFNWCKFIEYIEKQFL